jgi:uncharacterized protein (TIGR00288 family)
MEARMNNPQRVMLLIDADNVSADVIDQAVEKVHAEHGAIHVRRAYCTAESALANLKLFKAHSIRPIVNLSTGKNSTDISLAVDAMDLVLAERPQVVVIVSSDSDFAPLVIRLREKGCRVEGVGQKGKTGEDSKPVYDRFVDIEHRKARPSESVAARGVAPRGRARAPAAEAAAVLSPAVKPALRQRPARPPAKPRAVLAAAVAPPRPKLPDDLQRIMDVLPELKGGVPLQLGVAAERLRSEGLLAKRAPSTTLFKKFSEWFVLTPERAPNKVQYRGPSQA